MASKEKKEVSTQESDQVAVSNFKSNRAGYAEKKKNQEELDKMIAAGEDKVKINDAVRQPNQA